MTELQVKDKLKAEQHEYIGLHALGKDKGAASHDQVVIDGKAFKDMTAEEKSAAMALAQANDGGLKLASGRGVMFLLIMASTFLCGGDGGLDANVMSSVNSMDTYLNFFGLSEASKGTGIVFGIFSVAGVASFFFTAVVPDKFGRTQAMFYGNIILIAGALCNTFATSMPVFLFGRFLVGFGSSSAQHASRTYVAEMASPKRRGLVLGSYNTMWYLGSIVVSGISIPLGKNQSNLSWRLLLAVQAMVPVFNSAFVLWFPESPRWLYSRGRKEEALKVLAKYHTRHNDINSPLAQLEYAEIEENISSRVGLMVGLWGQLAGPASNYFTVLLKVAGIDSGERQRVLNLANSITSFTAAVCGAFSADIIGRRKLLLTAVTSATIGMVIIGGLLSGTPGPQRATVGIVFIYLFNIFVQFGWTPMNVIYPSEILNFEMRAKGLSVQSLFTYLAVIINTFATPAALVALNYKTYFIFAAFDFVGIFVIYKWAVETKGLPLEAMDSVFESENPKRHAFKIIKAAERKEESIDQA